MKIKCKKVNNINSDKCEKENLKMKNVVDFGKFSYELECQRENSLIGQSGNMLTAFSIYTAALYMIVPIVIEHFKNLTYGILLSVGIVSVLLIASLVLALISQWRFKYKTMLDIDVFYNYIDKENDLYKTQADYDYQWKHQLAPIQQSKKINNDKRVKLIVASMITFLCAIVVTILSIFVLMLINLYI